MANRIELVLEETEDGCIVPTSHKLNHDGYFRKTFVENGKTFHMMYHRYAYEAVHGKIPEGYEVDHLCKVRHCCNVQHLQLLLPSEHRAKDNRGRFAEEKQHAYLLWIEDPTRTVIAISKEVGVSDSAVYKWIREWKQ